MIPEATFMLGKEISLNSLHSSPHTLGVGITWPTVRQKAPDIFKEEYPRSLCFKDFLYSEKQGPSRIRKTFFVSRLAKRLTRKAAAKYVESWNSLRGIGGVKFRPRINGLNITDKKTMFVCKKMRVTLSEVMFVGLPGGRIPLAREYTFSSLIFSKGYVKTAQASE